VLRQPERTLGFLKSLIEIFVGIEEGPSNDPSLWSMVCVNTVTAVAFRSGQCSVGHGFILSFPTARMVHEDNDELFFIQELTSLGVNFEDEELIALDPLVDMPIDQEIIPANNYALPAAAPPPPLLLPLPDDEIRVRVETAIENVQSQNRSTTRTYRTEELFTSEAKSPRYSLKRESLAVFEIFSIYPQLTLPRRYREIFSNGRDINEVTLAINFFHHHPYDAEDLAIYRRCLLIVTLPPESAAARSGLLWSIVELRSVFIREWLAHRTQLLARVTMEAMTSAQRTQARVGGRRRSLSMMLSGSEDDEELDEAGQDGDDRDNEGEIQLLQSLLTQASEISRQVEVMARHR
jgi:hypothetical protein